MPCLNCISASWGRDRRIRPAHLRSPSRFDQVGDRKLVPAQPGEVHFTWVQPAQGEALLSPLYRRGVEVAVREAAAAAAQEVEHTGFGSHTQASAMGWQDVPRSACACLHSQPCTESLAPEPSLDLMVCLHEVASSPCACRACYGHTHIAKSLQFNFQWRSSLAHTWSLDTPCPQPTRRSGGGTWLCCPPRTTCAKWTEQA